MNLEIHYSYFILVGILLFGVNGNFVVSSALFSFLHELVHGGVAKKLGYTPEKISLGLFGGVLHLREGFLNPRDELFIHLAGPLFNLTLSLCLFLFVKFQFLLEDNLVETYLFPILVSNLILGIFNLMPFYPLDGGKILELYLAFFCGYGTAKRISQILSVIFSIFLFIFGIYLIQYNVLNSIICGLALNLYIAKKQENTFIFYKVSKNMEQSKDLEKNKKNKRKNKRSKLVVYREGQRAMKVIESYKPGDNHIFTIVNDHGSYKGQLTEEELLAGIYDCGVYADFGKLLELKKRKK
ncbi:MAG: site-2 protease family protein [Anaerovorax sp.]